MNDEASVTSGKFTVPAPTESESTAVLSVRFQTADEPESVTSTVPEEAEELLPVSIDASVTAAAVRAADSSLSPSPAEVSPLISSIHSLHFSGVTGAFTAPVHTPETFIVTLPPVSAQTLPVIRPVSPTFTVSFPLFPA